MSTVADCPDESTCPGVKHEWTPEPTVIHKPRTCLRSERALCRPLPEGPRQLDAHEVWCTLADDHGGTCALSVGVGALHAPDDDQERMAAAWDDGMAAHAQGLGSGDNPYREWSK